MTHETDPQPTKTMSSNSSERPQNEDSPPLSNVHRTFFQRINDLLWGYDFFISYHWASGGAYAVNMAQRLRAKNFDVFLDRADYASGDDWKRIGEIALRNTQRLVLVATREAVTLSKPVEREVIIFTDRGRQVIPIVFGDRFTEAEKSQSQTLSRMPDSQLFIEDSKQALIDGPSDATIERLFQTHGVLRRRNLRALLTLIPAIAVMLFASFAFVSWLNALVSRDEAIESATLAHQAKDRANHERDAAKQAEETSSKILKVIEKKAEKDVVIHGVLMEAFRVTIDHLEEKRKGHATDPVLDRNLAELCIGYAWHLNDHGDSDQAIKVYSRSLDLLTALSDSDPTDANVALRATFVMNNIGWCYAAKGDAQKAIEQHELTLKRRRELLEQFPNEFEAQRQIPVSLSNLSGLYKKVGRTETGTKFAAEALESEEILWKKFPNNRWAGLNYSYSLADRSSEYLEHGDVEKAIAYKIKAYDLRRQLYHDAKAGKPSDDGLGDFNFEEKYGKISYELAQLLITADPKNSKIAEYLKEGLSILKNLHHKNVENDEYRLLYAAALEAQARWFLMQEKSLDALESIKLSHDTALGQGEKETERLMRPESDDLRVQQLSSTSLLAYCLANTTDTDRSLKWIFEAADLYCRNSEMSGDVNEELPEDFTKAVRQLGASMADDSRVKEYLKNKESTMSKTIFEKLKTVFWK